MRTTYENPVHCRRDCEDTQSRILALEIAVCEALGIGKSSVKKQREESIAVGLQAKQLSQFKTSRPGPPKRSASLEAQDFAKRLASENARLSQQLKQLQKSSQASHQKLGKQLSNIEVTLQQLLVAVASAVGNESQFSDPRELDEDRMLRDAVLLSQITELQRQLDAKTLDIALMASAQQSGRCSPPPYRP